MSDLEEAKLAYEQLDKEYYATKQKLATICDQRVKELKNWQAICPHLESLSYTEVTEVLVCKHCGLVYTVDNRISGTRVTYNTQLVEEAESLEKLLGHMRRPEYR